MAFRYANRDDVLRELDIDGDDASNTALIEQIERMEHALASAFDHKVGRSFGADAVPATRIVTVNRHDDTAVLQSPARVVSAVHRGGQWDGTEWLDEQEVEGWYSVYSSDHLIYGLRRSAGWDGDIRVTAVWGSDSEDGVPDDVSHALTWLTVRQHRRVTASPNELVGPEGFTVPTPHAWDDPMVKEIIEKYRVVEVIV